MCFFAKYAVDRFCILISDSARHPFKWRRRYGWIHSGVLCGSALPMRAVQEFRTLFKTIVLKRISQAAFANSNEKGLIIMPTFYRNSNAQPDGFNEVHVDDNSCSHPPLHANRQTLGWHSTCTEAVRFANQTYGGKHDGCAYCTPNCHTR